MNTSEEQIAREYAARDIQPADLPGAQPIVQALKQKSKKKPMTLRSFLANNDRMDLLKQARELWINNEITTGLWEGFNDEAARARARRQQPMGAMPIPNPQDAVDRVTERLNTQQVTLNDMEERLRKARQEQYTLEAESVSLDPKTSALAQAALAKLRERILPDLQLAIKEQRRGVEDTQAELRRLRSSPPPKETDTGPTGPIWN